MVLRCLAALAVCLLVMVMASPARAAESNFVPGNESDGTYVSRAERGATNDSLFNWKQSEFVKNELERSGLDKVGDNVGNFFSGIVKFEFLKAPGEFLKEQEERYKERRQGQGY